MSAKVSTSLQSKRGQKLRSAQIRALIGGLILVLVVMGGVLFVQHRKGVVSSTTSHQVSLQDVGQVAGVATTIPQAEIVSPEASSSIRAILANFYAAYESKDVARLETFFTPDITQADQAVHAQLFTSTGVQGSVTGTTLFVADTLLEVPTSYTVLGATQDSDGWTVSLTEQRTTPRSNTVLSGTFVLKLVQAGATSGGWQISFYEHTGSVGKYDGFFTH